MKLKDVFYGILILTIGFVGGYFLKGVLKNESQESTVVETTKSGLKILDLGEIKDASAAVEDIKAFQRNYGKRFFGGLKSYSFSIDSLMKMITDLKLPTTPQYGTERYAIRMYPAYNSNSKPLLYFVLMGEKWIVDPAKPSDVKERHTMLSSAYYNHTDPCPDYCPPPDEEICLTCPDPPARVK